MQFLKILFWCLLAFVAALFTLGNWQWVTIQLFGNLVAEVNLPLLLLLTFLLGFIPTFLYYKTSRWRLRQRLTAAERTIEDFRMASSPTAPVADRPIEPDPVPAAEPEPGPVVPMARPMVEEPAAPPPPPATGRLL